MLEIPVKVLQRYYDKVLRQGITKVLRQDITKVLRQGITTRYYDIFVQPSYRGEVLRSITCLTLKT